MTSLILLPPHALMVEWIVTIRTIYNDLLNRLPDPSGIAGWMEFFAAGGTGEEMTELVKAGHEYVGLHPPTPPVPPQAPLPSRVEVLAHLRADICMRGEGDTSDYPGTGTWEALSWDDARFAAFASRYLAAGHRLLPVSMVVRDYLGVSFDYAHDLPTLRARLLRVYRHGLIPMLALNAYDEPGRGVETVRELPAILASVADVVCAAFTGWEIEVRAGHPSLYTGPEHLAVLTIARAALGPDAVLGVEFNTDDDRTEPITWDGRVSADARTYYTQTSAREVDVLLLRLPYPLTSDFRRAADEVGGALCRFTGLFPHPSQWPDGGDIPEAVRANWRMDYLIGLHLVVFEYASYLRWTSSRKKALRLYLQQLFPSLSGYGEG